MMIMLEWEVIFLKCVLERVIFLIHGYKLIFGTNARQTFPQATIVYSKVQVFLLSRNFLKCFVEILSK